jgi:hypothetical protein
MPRTDEHSPQQGASRDSTQIIAWKSALSQKRKSSAVGVTSAKGHTQTCATSFNSLVWAAPRNEWKKPLSPRFGIPALC